jgi:hypothetical protein
MHQMAVNVEKCGFIGLAHNMAGPDFVKQSGGHGAEDSEKSPGLFSQRLSAIS